MKKINEKIVSNYTVSEDLNLLGMIIGNVDITKTSTLTLNGIITGDIYISKDAKLIVRGTINGNIFNSGYCQIFGVINGKIIDKNGKLKIESNSIINSN